MRKLKPAWVILLSILVIQFSVLTVTGERPSWAREGAYLVYGGLSQELVYEEDLNTTIKEMEKWRYASLKDFGRNVNVISLVSVDESKGVFSLTSPSSGISPASFVCYWDKLECGKDFFFVYVNPSKIDELLKEASSQSDGFNMELNQASLSTRFGVLEVFEMRMNVTLSGRTFQLVYRFHKATGILLEAIVIETLKSDRCIPGKICYMVGISTLIETNIPLGSVSTVTTPIYSPTQTPTMSSIETPTQPSAGTAGFTIIVAVVAVLVGVGIGLAVARRR